MYNNILLSHKNSIFIPNLIELFFCNKSPIKTTS